MTKVTCNECGKDLAYGKKYIISSYQQMYSHFMSSNPSNTPFTLDFCSYQCINNYTLNRLSE